MSIRDVVRTRILSDVIGAAIKAEGRADFLVAVVDHVALRVLSAALKVYDLTEAGVALVEDLNKKRKPLPTMTAIYFISPSAESIDCLLADMSGPKPQYKDAHVFFTSNCEQELLMKIGQSNVVDRLKTMKVANLDFLAVESNAFSLDLPNALSQLYAPRSAGGSPQTTDMLLRICAQKLATVCATLGEYPFIRYDSGAPLTAKLAKELSNQIEAIYRRSRTQPTMSATVLIVDRASDPLSLLLHEFTYQAMVYDLLEDAKDGKYTYEFTSKDNQVSKRDALLDESDPLWPSLRHQHIARAIQHVVDEFNTFQSSNAAVEKVDMLQKGQVSEMSQLREAIKAMPRYNQMVAKYSLHLSLTEACMTQFELRKLMQLARWEQDMALGVDAEGHEVKSVLSGITPLLQQPDITAEDKQRLLMIYMITREGLSDADRRKLMDFAKLKVSDRVCIANLQHLGVQLERQKKRKRMTRDEKARAKERQRKRMVDVPYELSRYVPPIKDLIEDHLANKLGRDQYPYIRDPPDDKPMISTQEESLSVRTRKWDWHSKAQSKRDEPSEAPKAAQAGARLIVFVLGGMSYSEMRSVYEVTNATGRPVIIGSTSVLTPKQYLAQLANIETPAGLGDVSVAMQ